MRRFTRSIASALGLAMSFTACSGGHSSLPSPIGNDPASSQSVLRTAATSLTPVISVPRMYGELAFTDGGRRPANQSVNVALTLRYNNQAELDQLVADVSNPHSASYGQFITKDEFAQRFAPTAAQEQAVVDSLTRAGFSVTQRFDNRTIVDASAPSATVERYFGTEIHSVSQGKYGERYTNVRAATVPSDISASISSASLSNLVVVRTVADMESTVAGDRTPMRFATNSRGQMHLAIRRDKSSSLKTSISAADSTGALVNGNFASGSLSPGWIDESDTNTDSVKVTTAQAYQSTYSAFMGKLTKPEVNGWSSIAQVVTVPSNGILSFDVYQGSNEPNTEYAGQAAYLLDSNGDVLTTFYTTVSNSQKWVNYQVNLSAYAGQTDYIYFGCYGDGYSRDYTYQYVDDVAWLGSSTPTPTTAPTATPKPTTAPTTTPTTAPTATPKPTTAPTTSPTTSPTTAPTATAKPTTAPTTTPTTSPTTAPTATPKPTTAPTTTPTTTPTTAPTAAPTGGCNGAAADNGPLSNSDGTLASGVAKPFDYPVQHGCNGAGYTAAIIIDDAVNTSYVAKYLSAAAVTQTGTITNEAVDGGATGDDPETDLDVQTISGLAPGANIIVYDIGSLTDQAIEDGYNKVLSDGKAAAVNSSFGGCESSDPTFESGTNSIAEQGASEGVEFSASAGDTGSDECGTNDTTKGVSAPAGDPYFTSIGGVNFTYTTAGVLETVTAGDSSCGDASGTCYGGGGVSTVVAEPTWQQGIAGMITSGRNQPDISLPFDPVAVYTGGAFADYLGTSWSSPASVALFIEADELHGQKLGWLNPTLYSLFSSTGYSDYYTPCTSGNNIAYTCNASQYNQAAGIGTPKGWALAQAL